MGETWSKSPWNSARGLVISRASGQCCRGEDEEEGENGCYFLREAFSGLSVRFESGPLILPSHSSLHFRVLTLLTVLNDMFM